MKAGGTWPRKRPLSLGHRRAISAAKRGAVTSIRSVECRAAISRTKLENSRRRVLELGYKESPETRQKKSLANRGKPGLVESGLRSKNQWHHYPYLDRRGRVWDFKSSWEFAFATWLDRQELAWFYEPVLLLSTGQKWKVDFWVEEHECHYEVKGHIYDRSKYKQALLDGIKVVLIEEKVSSTFRLSSAGAMERR